MNPKRRIFLQPRMFKAVISLSLLAVLFLCQFHGRVRATPRAFGGIFDIVPDPPLLTNLPASGTSILLTGKVFPFRTVDQATCASLPANTTSLGTWRAWGQVAD